MLVAPGVSFNVPYRNHFRITNLPDAATLREVFARIEDLLASYAETRGARPRPGRGRRQGDQRPLPVMCRESLPAGAVV